MNNKQQPFTGQNIQQTSLDLGGIVNTLFSRTNYFIHFQIMFYIGTEIKLKYQKSYSLGGEGKCKAISNYKPPLFKGFLRYMILVLSYARTLA